MTIFEKHFWVVHFMLAQLESLVTDTLPGTLIPLDEDDDADLLLIASSD